MKLVYGTTNKAKIQFMNRRVETLGIKILSLDDVDAPRLNIIESGKTPLENARIKALAYYNALKMPVFSCDSGLYIEGLPDDRQPGVNVRGINDEKSDEETISFYSSIAEEFGGQMTARYLNAICLVMDDNQIYQHMGEDISTEPFYIVSKVHDRRREGFPLDSISVHIESGMYYYDRDGHGEKYANIEVGKDGFAKFFTNYLKL